MSSYSETPHCPFFSLLWIGVINTLSSSLKKRQGLWVTKESLASPTKREVGALGGFLHWWRLVWRPRPLVVPCVCVDWWSASVSLARAHWCSPVSLMAFPTMRPAPLSQCHTVHLSPGLGCALDGLYFGLMSPPGPGTPLDRLTVPHSETPYRGSLNWVHSSC